MNRKLRIIFTLSILLNVLLLGVLAGSFYKRAYGPHDGPPHAREADSKFSPRVAKAMKESRQQERALFDQMKDARKDIMDILEAPEFDEAAFNAASEKINKAQQALVDVRTKATLDLARNATAEERKELVSHMKAKSERFGRFRDRLEDRRKPAGDVPPPLNE